MARGHPDLLHVSHTPINSFVTPHVGLWCISHSSGLLLTQMNLLQPHHQYTPGIRAPLHLSSTYPQKQEWTKPWKPQQCWGKWSRSLPIQGAEVLCTPGAGGGAGRVLPCPF